MAPPTLTFSHWSGVTPYTSSYELAGSCVFCKQSPGVLLLHPPHRRKLLSLTYECFFAEFLGEESPVRLALLEPPTCVGLRYGPRASNFRRFSGEALQKNSLPPK